VGGRPLTANAVGILAMAALRRRTTAVGCGQLDFGALGCYKKTLFIVAYATSLKVQKLQKASIENNTHC